MEAANPLPRHQTPLPRPVKKGQPTSGSRAQSSALRASVLDAALQLGIGNNSLADWMFNESIQEDEEPVSSPALTYGSSATSEESSSSALTPSSSHSPNPSHLNSQPFGLHFPTNVIKEESPLEPSSASPGATVGFAEPARPTTPAPKGKLRKKVKGDGYESDAGYMSEGGKRKEKKEKEKKKKDKDKVKEKEKDKDMEASVKTEGESERTSTANSALVAEPEERKRKKSLVSVIRGKKSVPDLQPPGYDTDGGSISKSPSKSKSRKWKSSKAESSADAGVDYETDASASSKKSKSRFFKLGSKSSKANLKEPVPALPTAFLENKEPMPLPIAERFGTTLNTSTSNNDSSAPASPASATIPTPANLLPSLNFKSFTHSAEESVSSTATWNTNATSTTVLSSAPTSGSNPNGKFTSLRDSQASASAESSSSHSHAVRGTSLNAGNGRDPSSPIGNISRSTTPVSPSKQGSSFLPRAFSPLPSNSRATSPSPAMRMNPPISFPITRALSPSPSNPTSSSEASKPGPPPSTFVSPPTTGLRVRPSLENLNLLAVRNTQPSQLSPSSPYVVITPLVTPIRSVASSPALNGSQQEQQQSKLSPAPQFPARMSRAPSPMRIKPGDALYLPLPNSPAPGNLSPIGGPNSGGNSQYLNVYPNAHRESMNSIISSTDYVVPSPNQSPLPSPNTLSYYDIPPPTPPPMGPLPSVPAQDGDRNTRLLASSNNINNNNNANILPSPAALRQRVIDRSVRQLPEGFAAPIQRGKESPFPTRPVLPPPQPEVRQAVGIGSLAGGPGGGVGGGYGPSSSTGAAARKYRDIYPRSESPAHELIKEQAEKRRQARLRPKRSVHFDDDVNFNDDDEEEAEEEYGEERLRYDDDEDEGAGLRGVLDRFEMNVHNEGGFVRQDDGDVDNPVSATRGRGPSLDETFSKRIASPTPDLHRKTSLARFYENAARVEPSRKSPSPPPSSRNRPSEEFDDDADADETIPEASLVVPQLRPRAREPESEYTVGDRTSRWSGSVYSRNSILDEEESEQTRGRFIDRVKAMLSEKDGSGTDHRGDYVPPVPRLPDAYASGNTTSSASRWGRF
ncbi:hypothetical protein BJ165DRAFT_1531313 [Panaeolus papilionaceus]|nr:hypothetical protein BJ165DRAFT_1531313 [Panaeolus papilionaceus]